MPLLWFIGCVCVQFEKAEQNGMGRGIAHRGAAYFDVCLGKTKVHRGFLFDLAAACFLVAAKQVSFFVFLGHSIHSSLCAFCEQAGMTTTEEFACECECALGSLYLEELIDAERVVLDMLRGETILTSRNFLLHFLAGLSDKQAKKAKEMADAATKSLLASRTQPSTLGNSSSTSLKWSVLSHCV